MSGEQSSQRAQQVPRCGLGVGGRRSKPAWLEQEWGGVGPR